MPAIRSVCLSLIDALYSLCVRLFLFRFSAQRGHDSARNLLRRVGSIPGASRMAAACHRLFFTKETVSVGGVVLSQRLILAAGFLKSSGIPGWRFVPALVGPVEFGSFTRHPRKGNPGNVVWRRERTQSTQNRIGLRNVGAEEAARTLAQLIKCEAFTHEFGINIAATPGISDIDEQEREVTGSLDCFLDAGVHPDWFTLNISCPNTEDDPRQNQAAAHIRQLGSAFVNRLPKRTCGSEIPLWIKISPGLPPEQYHEIIKAARDVGVRAIVATNTLPQPSPDDDSIQAGVGGGDLRAEAMKAVKLLLAEKNRKGYDVDVIACGGLLDGESLQAYEALGVKAAQYWSALVYRGPFAAAIIEHENAQLKSRPKHKAIQRESLA